MKGGAKRNIRALADAKLDRRCDELVKKVKLGLDTLALDLQELRDDEHWKRHGFSTFADFCKDNFSISKTKLYTVFRGLEVIARLPKQLQSKITSDAQVLALAKLPENKRAEAIEKAESNGGISAENITLHAAKKATKTSVTSPVTEFRTRNSPTSQSQPVTNQNKKKDKTAVVLDDIDTPIPKDALEWWERMQEVQDILTEISHLKSIVVGGQKDRIKQWLKVTNSIADNFDSLRSLISEAKPYAVCTTCMGSPSLQPEGCNFCRSTGLISKWQWDTQSREEVKKIRLLSNADLKSKREAENVH